MGTDCVGRGSQGAAGRDDVIDHDDLVGARPQCPVRSKPQSGTVEANLAIPSELGPTGS